MFASMGLNGLLGMVSRCVHGSKHVGLLSKYRILWMLIGQIGLLQFKVYHAFVSESTELANAKTSPHLSQSHKAGGAFNITHQSTTKRLTFSDIGTVAKVGIQGRVLAPRGCPEAEYFLSFTRVLPTRADYSPITRSKELFRPRSA
ncbi:hypothetical protein R6Q59_000007 [Mikania micrantha]